MREGVERPQGDAVPGAGSGAVSATNWWRARIALAAVGLAVAAYLTILHYDTAVPLVCSQSGTVDCAQVLTSPQSVVLGLPVAAWGLLWFTVALLLAVRALRAPTPAVQRASLVWTLIGTATVLYLVATELLVVGKICLWCSAVHVIVLALLAIQVLSPSPDA